MSQHSSEKIETVLSKAGADPQFRQLLLAERSQAAQRIGLMLDAAEAAVLDSVPEEQLAMMIENAHRGPESIQRQLDRVRPPRGISPDRPP